MPFIMGIDTGGTYTDAVIIDGSDRKVLHKAKALTTKEDLTIGIHNSIKNLKFNHLNDISLVSLSTTLATNAIVEGRGCRTGLILIGSRPEGALPDVQTAFLQGKFDIKGRMLINLDEDQVVKAIEEFRGKVDALAISGYASVRNPQHEQYVKSKVRELLDLPVICAYELTSSLGFYERTVTAILNASLIPIIDDLIRATKNVLYENHIDAPVMIVKGDGSLMHAAQAIEKPIETILSGPAASIIGGIFLTGQRDALVLDMGGTTLDIADIRQGVTKLRKDGSKVGGWLTRVKAADIYTFGIGGDSRIFLSEAGKLEIGPQKVWPLCVMGKRFPGLIKELQIPGCSSPECFILIRKPVLHELSELEHKIAELLAEGPHSLFDLSSKLKAKPEPDTLKRMINMGVLACISLTPTDILHVEGKYNEWDPQIAQAAVKIMADQLNQSVQEFLNMTKELITGRLYEACLFSAEEFEKQVDKAAHGEKILKASPGYPNKTRDETEFSFGKTLIALGAPVSAWMQKVAEKLNTTLIIPEHSEVANAVGAAVAQVLKTVEILIRPDQATKRFIVYAPWERLGFATLEKAADYAISHGKEYAAASVQGSTDDSFYILENREDIFTEADVSSDESPKQYIETRIKIIAAGNPAWKVPGQGE